MAERAGFEPAVGYEPTHAFQACDLNHSSISPGCLARPACTEQVAEYSKSGYLTPLPRATKKMPPSPKARRQSGSRAIGVSPITFPHKPSLHYTTA